VLRVKSSLRERDKASLLLYRNCVNLCMIIKRNDRSHCTHSILFRDMLRDLGKTWDVDVAPDVAKTCSSM